VVDCIEQGYFQREIHRASYRYQQEVERKQRIIVGVNDFVEEDEQLRIPILYIDSSVEKEQVASLARLRAARDGELVRRRLAELTEAARDERANLMPRLIECARAYATQGEMRKAMGEVFGEHREAPEF
jgi:methylmalonyl-CoA mutase N-terminal domain/subunit